MRIKPLCLFTLGSVALLVGSLSAHAQTILNASFESPAPPSDPAYYTGAPTDFSLYHFSNATGAQLFVNGTASGSASLFINSNDNSGEGVYQDLGALQPDTVYTLTYAATTGTYQENNPVIENVSFFNGTDPTGTLLALSSDTLDGTTHTFTDYTLSYTTGATVAGDLTLLLANGNTGRVGQAAYDNLRLAAVSDVPEPSTWATLLGGLSLLVVAKRCRHKLVA